MLPKNKRLDTKTFQDIINMKRVISTPLLLFFVKESQKPQYAVVSPKNIFKTAVQRNKYRRIAYNILKSLDIKKGSGIFMYKKEATRAPVEKIEGDIKELLKKAKFIP